MTKQALHLAERGRTRPTREHLAAIVKRLGVPMRRVLAKPHDPREEAMAALEQERRLGDLRELAGDVLKDPNARGRATALARFYLARARYREDPEWAAKELRRVREPLIREHLPAMAAQAMDWEATALYMRQDPRALTAARQAIERYRELPDRSPVIEARMLAHIGSIQLQRNECAEAIGTYQEALRTSDQRMDLAEAGMIYHGMAEASRRLGNSRQALSWMERAIGLYRCQHDVTGPGPMTDGLARAENDYALQLMQLRRFDQAEEMIRAALDHFAEAGVEAGRTHALLSMGELYQHRGNLETAIEWTGQAIELAERMEAAVSIAVGYQQMGELFALQGLWERFEAAFTRAIEVLDVAELPTRRSDALARYQRLRGAASTAAAS
jgi:tetratricopeptide (TPR) repeat protein